MKRRAVGAFIVALSMVLPAVSQTAIPPQQLELVMPDGTRTATLRLPQGARRIPVVLLASSGPDYQTNPPLTEALVSHGIATLGVDVMMRHAPVPGEIDPAERDLAAWITRLRNDSRFERVMVGGIGAASVAAIRAARAARVDGYIELGPMQWAPDAVKDSLGPSIPRSIETDRAIEKLVRFIRQTPIPRHPETERRSPRDVVMADIAGSRISIEYGRPSKRGRVIWGTLVPWGRWWMPGADEATTFTTSKPIAFGSLSVPAGDYTIYTQPSESTFQLIVNKETGVFHTVYRAEQDLGHVEMQRSAPASPAEQLTFVIDARDGGGALRLIWDDREYVAPFVVGR